MSDGTPAIGIIGGSGLYQIEGLEEPVELVVDTPFGQPSDSLVSGHMNGRQLYFLPRHARGHRLLPTELNHRANIFALRSLNVRWILSVGAVGSLQEKYRPRDIVLPSQFFDRTSRRSEWTFFGNGIVAHVGFADPVSTNLRTMVAQEASNLGYRSRRRNLREHGWTCVLDARGVGVSSQNGFRYHRHDESPRG